MNRVLLIIFNYFSPTTAAHEYTVESARLICSKKLRQSLTTGILLPDSCKLVHHKRHHRHPQSCRHSPAPSPPGAGAPPVSDASGPPALSIGPCSAGVQVEQSFYIQYLSIESI